MTKSRIRAIEQPLQIQQGGPQRPVRAYRACLSSCSMRGPASPNTRLKMVKFSSTLMSRSSPSSRYSGLKQTGEAVSAGSKIDDVVDPVLGDEGQDFLGQHLGFRGDHPQAAPRFKVLEDQVAQQVGFARAALADYINVPVPIVLAQLDRHLALSETLKAQNQPFGFHNSPADFRAQFLARHAGIDQRIQLVPADDLAGDVAQVVGEEQDSLPAFFDLRPSPASRACRSSSCRLRAALPGRSPWQ